jgi:hypothetical protein
MVHRAVLPTRKSTHRWQGRRIKHIIEDINKFTSEHAGELIILDLSHDLDRSTPKWKGFDNEVWLKLYQFFGGGVAMVYCLLMVGI